MASAKSTLSVRFMIFWYFVSLFECFDPSSWPGTFFLFNHLAPWQVSPMCDRAVGEDSIPKQQLGPEHHRKNRSHATSFVSTGVFGTPENGKLWASRYFQNSLLNLDLLCTWICFMFELYSLSLCRSSGPTCSIPSYRTWFFWLNVLFFCFHHIFPSHFSAPRIEGFIDFIIAPYYTPLAELLPEALLLEEIRKQTQS